MGEIALLYGRAFPCELGDRFCHIHRIPDNDRIRHQIEAPCLIHQVVAAFAASLALLAIIKSARRSCSASPLSWRIPRRRSSLLAYHLRTWMVLIKRPYS